MKAMKNGSCEAPCASATETSTGKVEPSVRCAIMVMRPSRPVEPSSASSSPRAWGRSNPSASSVRM